MALVDDVVVFERDNARKAQALVDQLLPGWGANVEPHRFDVAVVIPHGDAPAPDPAIGRQLARLMRDGRDANPSRHGDWHLRSVSEERGDLKAHGDMGRRIGTRWWLSDSDRVPEGYSD